MLILCKAIGSDSYFEEAQKNKKRNKRKKKMKTRKEKILVIDDQEWVRAVLVAVLGSFGFQDIIQASSGEEGIQMIEKHQPRVTLTDFSMPGGMRGDALVRWFSTDHKPAYPEARIMGVASDDGSVGSAFLAAGADDFLPKPFENEELRKKVDALLAQADQVVGA